MRLTLCLLGACAVIGVAPAAASATPTAQNISAGTPQGSPVDLTLHGGSNLDSPVTFSIASGPSHGSLGPIGSASCAINPGVTACTAAVTYTPDPGFSGDDAFTYYVGDADGFTDATATITVLPLPPPGFTATAFGAADPGQLVMATVPGLQATLTNPPSATGTAFFVLATYPESGLETSYDIRAISVGSGATMTATFHYVGDNAPALTYFDKALGMQVPLQSSLYRVDPVAHTITVLLNAFSSPKLTDLTGTLFIARPLIDSVRLHPRCVSSGARPSLRLALAAPARLDVAISRRKGSSGRTRCSRHRAAHHPRARFERARHLSRQQPAGSSRLPLPRLAPGVYRVRIGTAQAGTAPEQRTLRVVG